MKVKTTFLMLVLITALNGFVFGQLTTSTTYTAGDIGVDAGFQIASQSSTCPGALTVNIPLGATVSSVDVVYDFEAIPASGAYKSYQLSQLRCVSAGGINEGALSSFPDDWTTGVLTYARTSLTIANGVVGGGDIMFELHAGTTQGAQTGCSTEKMKINNGTWTVTVHFLDPSYPSPPSNPNPADEADAVSINIGSLTWDFGPNTEQYDLYFGTNNPPTTKVVDNATSGANGTYALGTLTGATDYFWQVVARNAAKNELAGAVWSFSTECLPAAIPIFVDFDNLVVPSFSAPHFINPTCWTLLYQCSEGYANQGVYMSTNAFSAPNCWMMSNEGDGEAWSMMIMPEMADNLNTLQLSFMAQCNYSIHPLSIGTMSDPNNAGTYTEFTTINPSRTGHEEYEISFSTYTGTDKFIAIKYEALNANTYDYTYIDDVVISAIPTCPKPKDLALLEVTTTTAKVGWLEQGAATQWNIEVILADQDPTGTPTVTVTENPFTLQNLEPETSYKFFVQANCGGGDLSLWSSRGLISTACLPNEIPVFENFDASTSLPACWSTVGTTGGKWQMQTYGAYSAPNVFSMAPTATNDVIILVSPPLSVADGSMQDIQLNFFAKRNNTEQNLIVGTISNPLDYTTFTPLKTIMPTPTYAEYEVWFNNYAGSDFHIAFKCGTLNDNQFVYLDDITIGLLPYCLNPIDLSIAEIHETDARLSFTESREATAWEIEIGPVGFTPGTGAQTQSYTYQLAGNDYSFVMTGLESGTFYDVYMRADCGDGDLSRWSPKAHFMSQLELFSTLPLIETFDPDFTFTGNPPTNKTNFTLNTTLYHSAPNSAWNQYNGISNNVLLVTKRFDLTSKAKAFLSFWHIAKTDGTKDHCYVEVSTDGGVTFDQIPASAYFGTGNYYESTLNFPEGPAFDEDSYTDWGTGNQTPANTWWKNETFDLSGYSGSDNVVIRFRLFADQFTNRYGWLIDDVTIGTYTGVEINVNPLSFDINLAPNASTTQTLTISNNGDFPILYSANVQNYTDAITTLASEDFEAGLPATWTVLNEGTSSGSMWHWEDAATTTANLNGTSYMSVNRNFPDTCNESLISPSFDGTGFSNIFLTWDNLWAKGNASKPDFAEVSVWDGNQWQSVIFMKTINIGAWGSPDQTIYDITDWANPDMKVRFHYEGVSYSKTAMDNFKVTASDIPLDWLTLDSENAISGMLQGGESRNIEVGFAARPSFPFGKWNAEIDIVSSDPANSHINIPVSMTIGCQQPWEYIVTNQVHSISIPLEVAPEIFGEPLAAMDWIGVFYIDGNGEEACGGAVQWNGTSGVAINAYGDDATTTEKDGFAAGEAFIWKLNKCGGDEYPAVASYNTGMTNQGHFANFGISKLESLNAAIFQNYQFTAGWNSMSTYLLPSFPAVESIFAPMVNNLILIRNLSSLYWPAEAVNTIGNWDNNSGYVLKVTEDFDFSIHGEAYAGSEVTIPAGWSYLPVISQCPVSIMDMFGDNLDDVIIIHELIGSRVFWPAVEIYTLETFEPGKAYSVKLANPMLVSFPVCALKAQAVNAKQSNKIETAWGTIEMNPVSQLSLFMAEALGSVVDGDVIGAFDQEGKIYGNITVHGKDGNLAMTIFGNDNLSPSGTGFNENEPVRYKLMRSSTGEEFDLKVTYSPMLENRSGNFVAGSFAAISDLKLKATGIEGVSANGIGFYPNPASQTLNITGVDGNTQVSIFNVFGKEVYSTQISSPTGIDLTSLSSGTYLVKITDGKGLFVDKLIIQ
jgi:hypothetical protein